MSIFISAFLAPIISGIVVSLFDHWLDDKQAKRKRKHKK